MNINFVRLLSSVYVLIDFARMSFSLIAFIRSAGPFEIDRGINSVRTLHNFTGLIRSMRLFASLAHSIADEFVLFIVAHTALIYFRDLISIPTQLSSQISLFLALQLAMMAWQKDFFLFLLLRRLVLGVATRTEEDATLTMVLVAVIVAPIL